MSFLGLGTSRKQKAALSLAVQQGAEALDSQRNAAATTEALLKKANLQQKKQNKQLSKENKQIRKQLSDLQAIADRPDPPAPPPAAVMVTGGTAADDMSQDDSDIDVRRRGRNSLKIDLGAPQSGGGATGLNVPRG